MARALSELGWSLMPLLTSFAADLIGWRGDGGLAQNDVATPFN